LILVRSFLVLYYARQTREKTTGLGKPTIFLALGPPSCGKRLPKFENDPTIDLESGNALFVGKDTLQMLDANRGDGFDLVLEWTA
jgi:hypothetical protein